MVCRTVPLGKMENSVELEVADSVISLPRQMPVSHQDQEGSAGEVPSSNKVSDTTSDSSEEKQVPNTMTEVGEWCYVTTVWHKIKTISVIISFHLAFNTNNIGNWSLKAKLLFLQKVGCRPLY